MKAALHAVGRAEDVLPFLALGAALHEVETQAEAAEAVGKAAGGSGALVILSEEFAEAAGKAGEPASQQGGALVFLSPRAKGAGHIAVEKLRERISRSVGVDLIAKAGAAPRGDSSSGAGAPRGSPRGEATGDAGRRSGEDG